MARTAVYLMHDTGRALYKIGISTDPTYRVKTLRLDFPSIELLHFSYLPTTTEARKLEAALHRVFNAMRKEGEWFDLSEANRDTLIKFLNERVENTPSRYSGKEAGLGVRIPEELLRDVKIKSIEDGYSFKSVVIMGLEAYLQNSPVKN
jgi:predicted DNA binding CopG/RHH family protein